MIITQQHLHVFIFKRTIFGTSDVLQWSYESSSPGESHPQALTEPYVKLSLHTALPIQPFGLVLFTLFLPLLVDNIIRPDGASPSLLSHYRTFNATTGHSAPVLRIGTLALVAVTTCAAPLTSKRQVLTFPTKPYYQVTPYFTPDAAWAGYR